MRAAWKPARTVQWISARGLCAIAFALFVVSCADIPSRPLALVHVVGSVADRDGAPVAGARVYFVPRERAAATQWPLDARTDSTGAFALDLFESRYAARVLSPQRSGLPREGNFEVQIDPRHARVDYRYDGYWVRGRVLDPTGRALAEANVFATGSSYGVSYEARFDSVGFAMLLPPDTYLVYGGPRYGGMGIPSRWLQDAVPVRSDTTWEIQLVGDPLTGTVTGPLGAPIAAALLTANGPAYCSAYTDGAGFYRLFLPPGAYGLALQNSPGVQTMDPPDLPFLSVSGPASYDVSVAGVTWTATVRLSTTGDPVPGVPVWAPRTGTTNPFPIDSTDAAGTVRFLVQPGRAYTVRVYPVPGLTQEKWWSPVIAGGDSAFDLLVDPAGAPAGRRPAP